MADYYQVLGVAKSATSADIKKAYKQLSLRFHPDKNPGPEQAACQAKFVEVGEAYSVLGDPDRRREYDSGAPPPAAARGGGGGGRSGGFPSRGRSGREEFFTHRDAFAMFDRLFAEMDRQHAQFFEEEFPLFGSGGQSSQRGQGDAGRRARGLLMDPFGMFQDDFFGGFGGGFGGGVASGGGGFSSSSTSFSTSSFSNGRGVSSGKSVSTSSFIDANGKRKTRRTTTIVRPDGSQETSTEEWEDEIPTMQNRIAGPGGGGSGGALVRGKR